MSGHVQETGRKSGQLGESAFGVFCFLLYIIGHGFYDGIAYHVRDWLFVEPALTQAARLQAKGGELAALPILQEQVASNPRNPRLLWALGDIYTKMDRPVLARFYFKALQRLDQHAVNPLGADAIDASRRDFAAPYQQDGGQVPAVMDVTHAVKELRDAFYRLKGATREVKPSSYNLMLNTPAANLGVADGYFAPDALSSCSTEGEACVGSGALAGGRLWDAIAAGKLAVPLSERGPDCCSVSLDDPDLRSLPLVEEEFVQRLDNAQGGFAASDLARTRARLAFRARVLAKQLYVLAFVDDANTDVPEQGWSLWSTLGLFAWMIFAVAIADTFSRWRTRTDRARKNEPETAALVRTTPDTLPASPLPPPAPPPPGERIAVPWRIAHGLLFLLLAGTGLGWLMDSFHVLPVAQDVPLAGGTIAELSTLKPPANGIDFAVGVTLLLAALLPLNQALRRRRSAPGPIDRLAGALSGRRGPIPWRILAGLSAVIAFGTFADLYFAHTVVHWTAADAAQSFKQGVDELTIEVNGRVVHGTSLDGGTLHLASFTPTLVRAFDRADIGIGMIGRPFEYPVPGAVPLVLLGGFCIAALLHNRRRVASGDDAPDRWVARGFLALGLVHLYILLWLTSAQKGVTIFQPDIIDPDWLGPALFILVAQLAMLASIHRRLTEPLLAVPQRWGWAGIYLVTTFGILPWVYYYADAPLLAPAMLWLLFYYGLAAAFWCLLTFRGRRREVAG